MDARASARLVESVPTVDEGNYIRFQISYSFFLARECCVQRRQPIPDHNKGVTFLRLSPPTFFHQGAVFAVESFFDVKPARVVWDGRSQILKQTKNEQEEQE
eukprot:SAG31_NODE_1980_length_6748_cov_2.881336_3_plen_102_part_00